MHLVLGGRLLDPRSTRFAAPNEVEFVGVYNDYLSAEIAWRSAAQRTVDDAEIRYFVVPLDRMLEPHSGNV